VTLLGGGTDSGGLVEVLQLEERQMHAPASLSSHERGRGIVFKFIHYTEAGRRRLIDQSVTKRVQSCPRRVPMGHSIAISGYIIA
jgi:hypothetical protein